MSSEQEVLVKYCFSKLKVDFTSGKEKYYSAIISELEDEGIIINLRTYEYESPVSKSTEVIIYQMTSIEEYVYSFSCTEKRSDVSEMVV